MTPERLTGRLSIRLVVAFVAVAVVAVAGLAALVVVASGSQVDTLVAREHRADAHAAAVTLARAYEAAAGWAAADLAPASAVAAQDQATLTVTDADGTPLVSSGDMMASMGDMYGGSTDAVPRGAPITASVVVGGRTVGYAQLRFPASGLPAPERAMRDALWRVAIAGTALAALAALLVALYVARRLTRPLAALTSAAQRLAAGDREARSGHADAPGELGALASSFDRMAASIQREDALRRNLVADVAHELRTPLTILRGQTEAVLDGLTELNAVAVESLHDEIVRVSRVVGDLETLASAEAAGLDLHLVPVDLAQVATDAADLINPAALEAGLSIELDAHSAPSRGDPARLHQVALNLLTNAIKFTPRDGRVLVHTWADTSGAHLQVTDSGRGIPDEELPHVFERFWRGGGTGSVPGSGVGLAVASELAAAHDGRIEAANASAGGAVFTLTLPA